MLRNFKLLFLCPIFFILGSFITFTTVQNSENCIPEKIKHESNKYYRTANFKNPNLVILIMSAPGNLDRRNVIRATWLSLVKDSKKLSYIHYFVIGSVGLSTDAMLHVSDEQSKYNDLLILPIHDEYAKLTYKVLQSFVWINEQINYGLEFNYLLKCDDDTFVRLHSLIKETQYLTDRLKTGEYEIENDIQNIYIQRNNGDHEKDLHVYWGYFNGNSKVKKGGKWRETNWVLCDNYLPYAQGGGYILSKGLVQYIALNAEVLM